MSVLFFMLFHASQTLAQNNISADSVTIVSAISDTTRTLFGGKITNSGYGGIILKFSSFNDQFAFMTGGRGAIIINDRFTLGGGGYGIANSIRLWSPGMDTTRTLKVGYGGLELGYIFYSGEDLYFGGLVLLAAGAVFWKDQPPGPGGGKTFGQGFKIFAVVEPALYGVINVSRFIGLTAGVSYRYTNGAESVYIKDRDFREFSVYLGVLFGTM